LSRKGAELILTEIQRNSGLLLCVASGSSPLGVYHNLAEARSENTSLFAGLRVIKLDEWGPLAAADPASCEYYVRREVIEPLGVSPERYLTFAGDAADPEEECRRYAAALNASGPIDIAVLGLGTNGHLGLNEPAAWLHDSVHVAELAEESRCHGMLAEAHTQPSFGLTLGLGDILRSRMIVLLVSGAKKRDAMNRLLTHQITTEFPASLLWTHRNTVIIVDREAHPAG
jgi:galactosamine-6-phosphate isomerase